MNRVRVLNGVFDPLTLQQTVDFVSEALRAGRGGWVCTLNVSMLIFMRRDARLQAFADDAMLVVADGQPLVWTAPLFGGRLPERVPGIDLMHSLCEQAARDDHLVWCLGSQQDVLAAAMNALRARYPGLRIEGSDGYFQPEDAAARADAIRESGTRLLFVGMGTPRQERFITEQWARLGAVIAVGVGGSFDVTAGVVRRAPAWMGRLGLEWLVRLLQEPRRLLPRYAYTNLAFGLLIAQTLWRRCSGG